MTINDLVKVLAVPNARVLFAVNEDRHADFLIDRVRTGRVSRSNRLVEFANGSSLRIVVVHDMWAARRLMGLQVTYAVVANDVGNMNAEYVFSLVRSHDKTQHLGAARMSPDLMSELLDSLNVIVPVEEETIGPKIVFLKPRTKHILRNPHGFPDDAVREARLNAVDYIESLEEALESLREYCESKVIDTKTYNR